MQGFCRTQVHEVSDNRMLDLFLLAGGMLVVIATQGEFLAGDGLYVRVLGYTPGARFAAGALLLVVLVYPLLMRLAAGQVLRYRDVLLGPLAGSHEPGVERALIRYQKLQLSALIVLGLLHGFLVLLTPAARALSVSPLAQVPALPGLLLYAPMQIAIVLGWVAIWPAERVIRAAIRRGGAGSSGGAASGLGSFLGLHIRSRLLFFAVPVSVLLLVRDVLDQTRGVVESMSVDLPLVGAISLRFLPDGIVGVVILATFLGMPLLLARLWDTAVLPHGELRARLEGVARRCGLALSNVLVWRTGSQSCNAVVVGLLPQCRYVLLTDALLGHLRPRQVEAVFAHELGHVAHRHILKLMLLCMICFTVGTGTAALVQWGLVGLSVQVGSQSGRELAGVLLGPASALSISLLVGLWFAVLVFWAGRMLNAHRFHRGLLGFGLLCVLSAVLVVGLVLGAQAGLSHLADRAVAGEFARLDLTLDQQGLMLLSAGVAGAVLLMLFGPVSRFFERQADTYAARCMGHEPEPEADGEAGRESAGAARWPWQASMPGVPGVLAAGLVEPSAADRGGDGLLCRRGADLFISAFDLVADLNGVSRQVHSWRHGSVRSRVDHLRRLTQDAAYARQFAWKGWLLSAGLYGGAAVACALSVLHALHDLRLGG